MAPRFDTNQAAQNGGGMAISGASGAYIRNSTFVNNGATNQGGGLYAAGSIYMLDGTLSRNTGSGGGGGLMLKNTSSATFINLAVASNVSTPSGDGGGILSDNSTARFINLLLTGNSASRAGGMKLLMSNIQVINASIVNNLASNGISAISSEDTNLTLNNTIVWNPTDTTITIGTLYTGSTETYVNSSYLQDGCPAVNTANCVNLISSGDPLFVSESTDWSLSPGSPLVDAGDVTALPVDSDDLDRDNNVTEPIPFDLNGNPRVVIGHVDMGAYETQVWNTSWTKAASLPLAVVQPDVTSLSLDRYLDRSGQSRWFKFSVMPGSKVTVTLTDLPANYDLALYRDISQAYEALTSSQDLVQLSAEFAPDTFSPDTFSPRHLQPGYIFSRYLLSRHLQPGYILPRHFFSRHFQPGYIFSRYLLSRYLQPGYVFSRYFQPRYVLS